MRAVERKWPRRSAANLAVQHTQWVDAVEKVPKCLLAIFSKETKQADDATRKQGHESQDHGLRMFIPSRVHQLQLSQSAVTGRGTWGKLTDQAVKMPTLNRAIMSAFGM